MMVTTRPDAPPAFHLLAKPTGAVCNLDCAYCFFLSKEMLYQGSRFRMADELLETYIRQLIEAHARVPVVQVAWQGGEPTLMGLDVFRRSVIDVFEEWVRRDVAHVYVQMFDTALANWVGEQPSMCVHCETCGLTLALEHTGDVYSCDHFVEPRYLLCNITDRHLIELVASEQQRQFGLDKRDALPRYCRECDVRFACHGGCPKDRFTTTPDGETGLNYLCPSFKRFFHHVNEPMQTMAQLLAADRAPAEIMRAYAAADARRSRNDACPCGSGRKWKHCHGDAVPSRPSPANALGGDRR